tara:strand:+ start:44300 stop:44473 length:174 start_codon:yes stop_codon:yes gene_type:complete
MISLEERIKEEINRLSSYHDEKTIHLINNVLRPMLQYIKDHDRLMKELQRVGSKHGL